MNPFAGQIGMNTMQASQAMPTLGNRQAMQQGEQSTLAQLLESYKQALERGQQGQQMRQSDFVQGSGALGALAQMAQTYMGGRVSRKANESAKELADRIMRAQTDAEQSKAQKAQMAKIAEEQRLMDARRKAYGNDQEMFALTGDVTKPARGVPFMSDQGLVIVDPVSGEFRPATPQGQQQQAGPPVTIDPSLPPEIQAAIRANPQQWASAPDGAQINVPQARQGVLRPYEKPAAPKAQSVTLSPSEVVALGLPAGTLAQRNSETGDIEIKNKPSAKPTAQQATQAKVPQLNNVTRGLDRIDKAIAALDGALVDTGPIDQFVVGKLPSGQELEAAVGGIQNSMLALTRVPGMGSQSDLEAKIAALQYPSLDKPPEVNRKTLENLRAFVQDLQSSFGAAPAAPENDDDALINKYLKP